MAKMKTFHQFLTETPTEFRLDMFPATRKHLQTGGFSGRDAERLDQFLPMLNPMLTAAEVANPRFVELKQAFGRLVECVFGLPESVLVRLRTAEGRDFDYYSYDVMQPNHLVGKLKKAEAVAGTAGTAKGAAKVFFDWFLPIAREMLPLVNAVESVKAKAVKRQPKPAEDVKAKYFAPMAKMESGRVVTAVLTKLTDYLKKQYADAVATHFIKVAEDYAALSAEQQHKLAKLYGEVRHQPGAWFWNPGEYYSVGLKRWTLAKDYKQQIQKNADRDANDMQQQFLTKNVKKLVSILEAKGMALEGEPQILKMSASRGVFEGDIRITFADDSAFTVRNKIVWKVNSYNTHFNQFPTTFHDVKLPNGQTMSQPSEERMNEVFTKA